MSKAARCVAWVRWLVRVCESVGRGVAVAMALVGVPHAVNAASSEVAFARAQLAIAHDLLARATDIVAATPVTGTQASLMVRGHDGSAGVFYDRERAYQSALMKHTVRRGILTDADSVISGLVQSDAFLFRAVQSAVAGCNRRDASDNLRVARAIIAEADRAMAGHANGNFEPPEIDPNGHVSCR